MDNLTTTAANKNHFKSIVSGLINDPRIPLRLSFADVVDIMVKYDNLTQHLAELKLFSNNDIPIIKVSDFSTSTEVNSNNQSLQPEMCENTRRQKLFLDRLMLVASSNQNKTFLKVPNSDYKLMKSKSFDDSYIYKCRKNDYANYNNNVKPLSSSSTFSINGTSCRKVRQEKLNLKRRFVDGYQNAKNKFWTIRPSSSPCLQSFNSCALIPDQIYRLGQTKLYWRSLPVKESEGTILEHSSHRDQLTVLFCTNLTGTHKLRPLVVGSSSDPRVIQDFEAFVVYKYSKDGHLTGTILNEWLNEHFVPEIFENLKKEDLPQRSMLALDPSVVWYHPLTQLLSSNYNIETVKLTNSIAVHQTVVGLARLQYKKHLLLDAVSCPHMFTKLYDAVALLRIAWDRVMSFDIEQCCQNILPNEEKNYFSAAAASTNYNSTVMLKAVHLQQVCPMEIQQLLSYLPGGKDLVRSEIDNWIYYDQGLIINKNPFF